MNNNKKIGKRWLVISFIIAEVILIAGLIVSVVLGMTNVISNSLSVFGLFLCALLLAILNIVIYTVLFKKRNLLKSASYIISMICSGIMFVSGVVGIIIAVHNF